MSSRQNGYVFPPPLSSAGGYQQSQGTQNWHSFENEEPINPSARPSMHLMQPGPRHNYGNYRSNYSCSQALPQTGWNNHFRPQDALNDKNGTEYGMTNARYFHASTGPCPTAPFPTAPPARLPHTWRQLPPLNPCQIYTKKSFKGNNAAKNKGKNCMAKKIEVDVPFHYCDPCEREFKNLADLQSHEKSHTKCEVDGCSFFASKKILKDHFSQTHDKTTRYQVVRQSNEDVEKWKAERRKNYPSASKVMDKGKKDERKKESGGVLATKQFSYKSGSWSNPVQKPRKIPISQQADEELDNHVQAKELLQPGDTEVNSVNMVDNSSASSLNAGSTDIKNVTEMNSLESAARKTTKEASKFSTAADDLETARSNILKHYLHDYLSSDESLSDSSSSDQKSNNNIARKTINTSKQPDESSLRRDSSVEIIEARAIQATSNRNLKEQQVNGESRNDASGADDADDADDANAANDADDAKDATTASVGAVEHFAVNSRQSEQTLSDSSTVHRTGDREVNNIIENSVKNCVKEAEQCPVVMDQLRKNNIENTQVETVNSNVSKQTSVERNNKQNKRKRDGNWTKRGCPAKAARSCKPTLLEMLLAKDIRHERNVILQCVRHTVKNNFFMDL